MQGHQYQCHHFHHHQHHRYHHRTSIPGVCAYSSVVSLENSICGTSCFKAASLLHEFTFKVETLTAEFIKITACQHRGDVDCFIIKNIILVT
jgi:hypothetical protein